MRDYGFENRKLSEHIETIAARGLGSQYPHQEMRCVATTISKKAVDHIMNIFRLGPLESIDWPSENFYEHKKLKAKLGGTSLISGNIYMFESDRYISSITNTEERIDTLSLLVPIIESVGLPLDNYPSTKIKKRNATYVREGVLEPSLKNVSNPNRWFELSFLESDRSESAKDIEVDGKIPLVIFYRINIQLRTHDLKSTSKRYMNDSGNSQTAADSTLYKIFRDTLYLDVTYQNIIKTINLLNKYAEHSDPWELFISTMSIAHTDTYENMGDLNPTSEEFELKLLLNDLFGGDRFNTISDISRKIFAIPVKDLQIVSPLSTVDLPQKLYHFMVESITTRLYHLAHKEYLKLKAYNKNESTSEDKEILLQPTLEIFNNTISYSHSLRIMIEKALSGEIKSDDLVAFISSLLLLK